MGVSVSVGMLADLLYVDEEGASCLRRGFDAVNRVLRAHKLPPHFEPELLPPLRNRCSLTGYPYSYLHHLRRVYARRKADKSWIATPLPPEIQAGRDEVLLAAYGRLPSHLLNHSDAEGFYVPIEFKEVLFDPSGSMCGEELGSSYTLCDELLFVAPSLNIELNGNNLLDDQAEQINLLGADEELMIEKIVWLSLFEACRLSIEHKTAIVFS